MEGKGTKEGDWGGGGGGVELGKAADGMWHRQCRQRGRSLETCDRRGPEGGLITCRVP